MKYLLTITIVFFSLAVNAQPEKKSVVIGSLTTRSNALLIVNPPHSDQGVLLPQLSSAQRAAIRPSSPDEDGLIVYDKDVNAYYYWSEGKWMKLTAERDTKVTYYNIDPIDFQELKPDYNIRHVNMVVFESDNTFVTASRNGQGEEIIAPLNLPHGAIMKEVMVYYMDNSDNNIKISLLRKRVSESNEEILTWESTGRSPLVNNVSFTNFDGKEKIDLENYTYRVLVAFDIGTNVAIDSPAEARQRVYGVTIKCEE